MLELLLELTLRTLYGFVCALPGIGIWFAWLGIRKKTPGAAHTIGALVFCLYLSGVLAVTGIGRPFRFAPTFNFLPFVDMIKGPIDTTLNVLLFLPLGVFLPLLYRTFERARSVTLAAFGLYMTIELIQMFGLGITDINDLMTNTAGACLGFCLSRKLRRRQTEGQKKKLQAVGAPDTLEVLLLAAGMFVSAMVLVPAWC